MADFTFLNPWFLLALLPLNGLLMFFYKTKPSSGLLAAHLTRQLARIVSPRSIIWLAVFWNIAVLALAQPSFEKVPQPAFAAQKAKVIVFDLSASMRATDILPSRLQQAQFKALDLISAWHESQIGLVAFAGDAYSVAPMTSDANTLNRLITHLDPNQMPYPGSNAVRGVEQAIKMLNQSNMPNGEIILISDSLTSPQANLIAQDLKDTPWHLSSLMMGTTQGATVSDPQGNQTHVSTDDGPFTDLANQFGGKAVWYNAQNSDIKQLTGQAWLDNTIKKQQKDHKETDKLAVDNGYWLLPLLLVSLAFAFRKGAIFSLLLISLWQFPMIQDAHADVLKNDDQVAYQLYQQGHYQQAAEKFTTAKWQGLALYKAGDFAGAISHLQGLTDEASRYNLANAYIQTGQYQQAIELYNLILANNPQHKNAKKNLHIAVDHYKRFLATDAEKSSSKAKSERLPPSDRKAEKPKRSNKKGPEEKDKSDKKTEQTAPDSTGSNTNKTSKPEDQDQDIDLKSISNQGIAANMQGSSPVLAETVKIDPNLRKLDIIQDHTEKLLKVQFQLQAKQRAPLKVDPKDIW